MVVGFNQDLDFQNSQPELRAPFEPLLLVEQVTHIPIIMHKIFIKPDVENLAKYFAVTQIEDPDMSTEDASSKNADHIEQKLMSYPS